MKTLLPAFGGCFFSTHLCHVWGNYSTGNTGARPLCFALAVLRLKNFIKILSRLKKGKSWRKGKINLFPPFYLQTLLSLLKLLLTRCLIPRQSRCEEGRYITVQHAQQGCQLSINLWTVCRPTGVLWKILILSVKTGKLSWILAKKNIYKITIWEHTGLLPPGEKKNPKTNKKTHKT